LERNGNECADRPRELKASFEDREGSALVCVRRVALHDALEIEPSERRHQIQHSGEHDGTERSTEHGDEEASSCADEQCGGQHRLFAHTRSQQ